MDEPTGKTTPTTRLPSAHDINWRCEACGTRGTFKLVSLRPWTREQRLRALFLVTSGEHRECPADSGFVPITRFYWDFPPSWDAERFEE